MRLYSPVDLTGNVNVIEVSLGWDWNRGPPEPQLDHPRDVNQASGMQLYVHVRSFEMKYNCNDDKIS